ncbi:PTS sugar transporter subunit IIA [Candidatus Venteria ishoeyi]|uniref:Nitrogen regulatory protein n=1 Tax=Candidatus Venteria ishoeyi TaxID=1899563 RepID=A0A1H6FBI5_9GAMM|nr:PTS sugar transporter subunit IIA [Candidatus Venteria ishoeyi]MDM8545457.1 PTS sugar transporter subunit IIA [Candidatus Venteria ishoeyi]SEH06741.1 Nitrogen regulatory protein [Candidatus Venteria ishoeyi]
MQISSILTPGRMAHCPQVGSKRRIFEKLADLLAQDQPLLEQEEIYNRLLERERLGSTGLGKGIAIPHARISELTHTSGAFIQLQQGVDFNALDEEPVDIVFALLVPDLTEAEQAGHLQTLANLVAMLSDQRLCQQLRKPELELSEKYRLMEQWHKSTAVNT